MIDFPHAFVLQRDPEPSESSGQAPSIVATGAVFPDSTVSLRWSAGTCTTLWHCIEDAVRAHCRDGRTRVVFVDPIGKPLDEPLRQRVHQAIRDSYERVVGENLPLAAGTTEAMALTVMAIVQPEIDRAGRELAQLVEAVGGREPATTAIRLSERLDAAEAALGSMHRERAQLLACLAPHMPDTMIAPAPDIHEPGWQTLHMTVDGDRRSWYVHPQDASLFDSIKPAPSTPAPRGGDPAAVRA